MLLEKKKFIVIFVLLFMFSCSGSSSKDGIWETWTWEISKQVEVVTPEAELEKVKVLFSQWKMVEVEEEYERLVKEYPENEEIRKWYDMFLAGPGTELDVDLDSELEMLNELISMRKVDEVEKMYKELMLKYPDNPWLKEGYETFLSGNYSENMDVDIKLEEVKNLVNEWKNSEAERTFKELMEEYPDHIWVKGWYETFLSDVWADNIYVESEFEKINELLTKNEFKKVEEIYQDLMKKYPEHEWLKRWYEAFLAMTGNDSLEYKLNELKKIIEDWKNEEAEKMYKELMEEYPENSWVKDWYDAFLAGLDENNVYEELEKIKGLITEWKYEEVEEMYKELLEDYPDNVWVKEWYKMFLADRN